MDTDDKIWQDLYKFAESLRDHEEEKKLEDHVDDTLNSLKTKIHKAVDKFFNLEIQKKKIMEKIESPYLSNTVLVNCNESLRPITDERKKILQRQLMEERRRSFDNYHLNENLVDELRYFLLKDLFEIE